MDEAQDRLVRGHARGDEDGCHNSKAGEALGAWGAQRERNAERDRGQGVAAVVDQVSEQRQAAGEGEHERLHRGGAGENAQRERDGPDALAGALDALVNKPMRMTVRVLVVIVMRVLMAIVVMRPGVWVSVA